MPKARTELPPLGPVEIDFLTRSELMTPAQFARLAGISPQTEPSMRARGNCPPFVKKGYAIYYAYSDVAKWLTESRVDLRHRAAEAADAAIAADLLGVKA